MFLLTKHYQLKTSQVYPERTRGGFALIFVLLFATIALMVGTSIVVALISGMKLNRQTQQGAEAYLMARGGIDAAANELRSNSKDSKPVWPTDCSKFNIYYRKDNTDYTLSSTKLTLSQITDGTFTDSAVARKYGFYAARMCFDTKVIESIGFFQGRKITLKAVIKKNPAETPILYHYKYPVPGDPLADPPVADSEKEGYCTPNTYAGAPVCTADQTAVQIDADTKYDHTKELIKIYQTGS